MTGEAFVRQRGKKLQIGNLPSMIDVNNIWRSCVHWRCQVKRRAEKFFHGFMYRPDFEIYRSSGGEILLNIFFQKLHDPCGLHIWQIHFLI